MIKIKRKQITNYYKKIPKPQLRIKIIERPNDFAIYVKDIFRNQIRQTIQSEMRWIWQNVYSTHFAVVALQNAWRDEFVDREVDGAAAPDNIQDLRQNVVSFHRFACQGQPIRLSLRNSP